MIPFKKIYFLYFLLLVYLSGSIGFVVNPTFFSPFTPYTLLFTCFVFLLYQPLQNYSFIKSFIIIAFLGYIIEVIGVKTGLIFGNYEYGNSLGLKFLEVPLIISCNWALLITAGIITVNRFFSNKFLVLGIAAILVTTIDLIIEQVAFKLDFWKFEQNLAGVHNYIGWFCVAAMSPYFFYDNIIKGDRSVAVIVLILQVVFFSTLLIFI